MPTLTMYRGARRPILAWGDDGSCATIEFLEQLESDGNKDYDRLQLLIRQAGDDQPSRNKEKCHQLEGSVCKDLYEFKGSGGSRLIWFYDKRNNIILTHGFKKPKNNKGVDRECRKAQAIKDLYRQETNYA